MEFPSGLQVEAGHRDLSHWFKPETVEEDQTRAHNAGYEPQCPWSQQVGGSALLVPATSSRSHARLSRSLRRANGLVLGHPVPTLLTSLLAWPLPRGPRGPDAAYGSPADQSHVSNFFRLGVTREFALGFLFWNQRSPLGTSGRDASFSTSLLLPST